MWRWLVACSAIECIFCQKKKKRGAEAVTAGTRLRVCRAAADLCLALDHLCGAMTWAALAHRPLWKTRTRRKRVTRQVACSSIILFLLEPYLCISFDSSSDKGSPSVKLSQNHCSESIGKSRKSGNPGNQLVIPVPGKFNWVTKMHRRIAFPRG